MTTAILLVLLGSLLRFAHLPWNAVPIMAIALYAGARLPRRWAVLVPLLVMIASDVVLDWGTGRAIFAADRLAVYFCLILTSLAGAWLKTTNRTTARVGLALAASVVFYLVTNFAVWAMPGTPAEPRLYPATLAGLVDCYVMGIPFYRNTLIAELVGTVVLFSLDGLAHRLTSRVGRKAKAPALAAAE